MVSYDAGYSVNMLFKGPLVSLTVSYFCQNQEFYVTGKEKVDNHVEMLWVYLPGGGQEMQSLHHGVPE